MIENKQGINDNTTNSNNTDIGNNKNNRITEKHINKSENIAITANNAPVIIDKSKKKFGKKIIESIQDNFLLFMIIIYIIGMIPLIITSISKTMPWWGILIMVLIPATYWFIIELIKIFKD